MMTHEEWRDVIGYEGIYQVSSIGRVKSLERLIPCGHPGSKPRRKKEKILNKNFHNDGYPQVQLNVNCKLKTIKVHRLVAESFIPKPEGCDLVNHIDGDKANNNVSNLEWCTPSYNQIHAFQTGLKVASCGDYHHHTKIMSSEYSNVMSLTNKYSQRRVAEMYGVSQTAIKTVLKRFKSCQ